MSDEQTTKPLMYRLWSNKHQAWWRPAAQGYTPDQAEAGRYTEEEAVRYALRAADACLLSSASVIVAIHPMEGQR